MPKSSNQVKVMATIGSVCLQMSLLEYAIAGVIWALLDLSEETGAIVTGGLDILPRINMAINLAEHFDTPVHVRSELRRIRKELQDGLLDRRNQAVHGAHLLSDIEASTTVKMHRWPHPKRLGTVAAEDLFKLSSAFLTLSQEADLVWAAIGDWKFPGPAHSDEHGLEDALDSRSNWFAGPWLKIAKLFRPGS